MKYSCQTHTCIYINTHNFMCAKNASNSPITLRITKNGIETVGKFVGFFVKYQMIASFYRLFTLGYLLVPSRCKYC